MRFIGYIRKSALSEDLEGQRNKLKHCHKIFEEQGENTHDNRPALQECYEYLNADDTLIVTRLSILAMSERHLYRILEKITAKDVTLQVIDQEITTSDNMAQSFLNILTELDTFYIEMHEENRINRVRPVPEKDYRRFTPETLSIIEKKLEELGYGADNPFSKKNMDKMLPKRHRRKTNLKDKSSDE